MRRVLLVPLLVACQEDTVFTTPERTESFVAGTRTGPTDVLFVVDDSASMREEQARLAVDISAMTAITEEAEADVRFGVVTTDVDAGDGLLRGGVHAPGAGLDEALAAALSVGIDGARIEHGFEAATLASDGRNAGFPRDDARMELVFFSDEDDQSPGEFDAWFDALWAVYDVRLRAHAVVGDLPSGCFSPDGAADPALRYVALVDETLGYQESICAPDYVGILERLGLDVAGIQDTFPLDQIPDPDSIAVTVDGVDVPGDPEEGWTYEPAPNAVVFHGDSVPAPGAEVDVTYVRLAGGRTNEETEVGGGSGSEGGSGYEGL